MNVAVILNANLELGASFVGQDVSRWEPEQRGQIEKKNLFVALVLSCIIFNPKIIAHLM